MKTQNIKRDPIIAKVAKYLAESEEPIKEAEGDSTLDTVIEQLQQLKRRHGNVPVLVQDREWEDQGPISSLEYKESLKAVVIN